MVDIRKAPQAHLISASLEFQETAWPRPRRFLLCELVQRDKPQLAIADMAAPASGPVRNLIERLIPSKVYPGMENDLARDNAENDLSAADLHELQ